MRIKTTKDEEEYIIDEISKRCSEVHRFSESAREVIDRKGGLGKILNGDREGDFVISLETVMVVGDFMQILQRCRDEQKMEECRK
ncbi:MAG: hypothetical protein MUP81_00200 [Dehalococcoidia bacterium]|nr:hypothetical protein [Dehalococcoidia bacterium]